MLLKVAMQMLLEKTAKVKKIYRARKYLYEFTRPGIDCVPLFKRLPRTLKFLKFEFNLMKITGLISSDMEHLCSNKYIVYYFNLPCSKNVMADREFLPEHIKQYARTLFLCNLHWKLPNEIIYLLLEKLL